MKKYGLACIFSFLYMIAGAADFQTAEQDYRDGHFAAALGAYEELLQTYPNNPFLYYNIGNCYFKMGSTGLAAANYYRAFRLAPREADIRYNLNLALAQSGERLVPQGIPEILHKAFFLLTAEELQGTLQLAWWFFGFSTIFWLLTRKGSRVVLVSAILLLLVGNWYILRFGPDHEQLAVVASPVAELRSGPGKNFPLSANVSQGHLLLLQDSRDNWREVVVKSQGIKGWMEASSLEKI